MYAKIRKKTLVELWWSSPGWRGSTDSTWGKVGETGLKRSLLLSERQKCTKLRKKAVKRAAVRWLQLAGFGGFFLAGKVRKPGLDKEVTCFEWVQI